MQVAYLCICNSLRGCSIMKPLANHVLIYDKDCPLCSTYTKLFLKFGFLDKNGRMAYQEMDFTNTPIDAEIAKNKIALINSNTKEVSYGIDAITKVIGNSIPFVSFFMKYKPLHWFMSQLYSLISYNRKIIIPVNCKNLTSCNPSKNWFWRMAFILLCMVPLQFAIPAVHKLLSQEHYRYTFFMAENAVFLTIAIFQICCCRLFGEKNIYDYIGHLSFISALGACIFLFLYGFVNVFIMPHRYFAAIGCIGGGLIFIWMLVEHHRRLKLLDMPQRLTVSWILWMIALAGIFYSM